MRFGIQQTPYVDFKEGIYRYRFQGTIFAEREGFLSSSDAGVSFHYNFPTELRRRPRRLLQRRGLLASRSRTTRRRSRSAARCARCRRARSCAGCGSPASTTPTTTSKDAERQPLHRRRRPSSTSTSTPAFEYLIDQRSDAQPSAAKLEGRRASRSGRRRSPRRALRRSVPLRPPRAERRRSTTRTRPRRSPASPTGSRTRAPSRPPSCSTTNRSRDNNFAPSRADQQTYRGARACQLLRSRRRLLEHRR